MEMEISRRDAIAMAAVAVVSAASAVALKADIGEDPHARLWADHQTADRAITACVDYADSFIGTPEQDGPVHRAAQEARDAAARRAGAILDRICETPARTVQGLAAQAAALAWLMGILSPEQSYFTILAGNLKDGLDRLAGGVS